MIRLLIFCFLFSESLYSQESIGSGGGSVSNQTIDINWTIGEVITSESQTGSISLSEGVNQPILSIVSKILDSKWNPSISIGPNPFSSFIYIKSSLSNRFNLLVYNINGKIIYRTYLKTSEIELNFSDFASGTYLFELTDHQGKKCVYKVFKK